MSALRAWSVSSVLALALVGAGCSSGGAGRLPGFSTAYAPPVTDAGAPDGEAPDGDALDGGAADGGAPDGGAPGAAGPILRAIAGSGAGNAWAVGDDGAAVRITGSAFTPFATGAGVSLGGLNVFDVAHAYAVERGGARVFAWSGRGWAPLGTPRADLAAAAAWATSANNVWVAGDGIDRWNGTTWTPAVPGGASYKALSGSFDTDVWAVGPGGAQHWNGKEWSVAPVPVGTPALAAVWVGGLYDAWVVGAAGTVLHWSGSTFTRITPPTTKDLTAITGTGTFDIWIGGQDGLLLHWDGTNWTEYTTPAGRTIESVWTSFGADIFFVDGAPTITRFAR